LRPDGYGFDAVWADDFHHVVRRRLAGDSDGYFRDYAGTTDELARVINQGFLYEGQRSVHLGRPRGTPARDCPAWQFVFCIQNHDQVGNRAFGDRLNHQVSPALFRAASGLLLLLPYTPLLFMGQEFGSQSPFQYFTDHSPELGKLVTEGRRREFGAHAAFRGEIPDPQSDEPFLGSKLDWTKSGQSSQLSFYRECLRLRGQDPVVSAQDRFTMRARVPSDSVLAVEMPKRLLLVNFGSTMAPSAAFHPENARVLLDSESPEFGGAGASRSSGLAPESLLLLALD
jgi:maltooligosyltrehalose trehalohydrolase